ncbi:hypothetical protein Tco_0235925 [Tanacetum coccineum]
MSYEHLKEIALRLIPHACFEKIYYCQTGAKLSLGVRELKSTQDIADMLKVSYDNENEIDLYIEHFGYDIMELAELERNEEQNHNSIESSDDEYYGSDDCEGIENVDFQTEGESVVIKNISTHDPFLNKLCSARIMFKGTAEHHETETPLVDPDENQIDAVNKVQSGAHYPAFDLDIPWDKMEPPLGMRYETPHQLKLALANYGVAHGYQLWHMKNDRREVLVYCGINVEDGRCAGVKKKVVRKKVVKKKVVKKKPVSDSGEGTSQSPKWTKKQVRESKQVVCPFRMYASWMSNEHSFQIKSLISEHKCIRNYNLGSLVSYRRAKQLALFDHEGGLIEHYGKLYQYRKALLDSNPGSTCRLDVDESANGSATFKRIYICFKRVKDGWLAWCRKMRNKKGLIRKDAEQERFDKEMREEREWEEKQDYFNPANFREDSIEEALFNQAYAKDTTDVTIENINEAPASETTDVSAMVEDLSAPAVDKGKGKESVEDQASSRKKKRGRPPSHVDGIRIYHKNHGRSERIANMKEKKAFQFDKHGTGSTPDKAFNVDD